MNPQDEIKRYFESQLGQAIAPHFNRPANAYTITNLQVDLDRKLRPQGFNVTVEKGPHALTFKTNINGEEVALTYRMKW